MKYLNSYHRPGDCDHNNTRPSERLRSALNKPLFGPKNGEPLKPGFVAIRTGPKTGDPQKCIFSSFNWSEGPRAGQTEKRQFLRLLAEARLDY